MVATRRNVRTLGAVIAAALLGLGGAAACGTSPERGDGADSAGSASEEDRRPPEQRFQWSAKAPDPHGVEVYAPPAGEGRGQVLSTATRTYDPGSTQARESRPENIIFQITDLGGIHPVAFSTSDGPTGFDGLVPVGYTQSAAGAALAAQAYMTAPTGQGYGDLVEKVVEDATDADRRSARQHSDRMAGDAEMKERSVAGYYPASEGARVALVAADRAEVMIYERGQKADGSVGFFGRPMSLHWAEGRWKISSFHTFPRMWEGDQLPPEAWQWFGHDN
ncbi:hypothetical protein [Corynebacterium heidelbergense]|uniref:DUF8175 domain-containing protein n=1 Tax=Corynebacterium heidelbergense TaxID=2055947 RepID=A0A364V9S1_9CORY|nr:hypothetical protein [Corynebacterium heidelbergense]RAV33358.1 hypothetical protein CWC39_08905 [Corynebacterium heidelbergense]WCZ37383.1 hypothetical protein CHEID_09285 [Corynebacterium heidelbergense]